MNCIQNILLPFQALLYSTLAFVKVFKICTERDVILNFVIKLGGGLILVLMV